MHMVLQMNNQVSLVEEEGFGSPFFYSFRGSSSSDRRTLKRKTRKLAFVLSNFLRLQKCHTVAIMSQSIMSQSSVIIAYIEMQ
jgi:hypothetical protein